MVFRRGYIYLLYHEESDSRYIGKTVDLKIRYNSHINMTGGPYVARNIWIKSLLDKGLRPKIEILKVCNYKDSSFYEILLIDWFKRMGFKLVNGTDGGDGTIGWKPSEETKRKISISNTGKKMSPGHNHYLHQVVLKGRKRPESECLAISKSLMGNKRRQGHIPTNAWKPKLNYQQVKEIKSKLFCGFVGEKLAKEYKCGTATISRIRSGTYFLPQKEANKILGYGK